MKRIFNNITIFVVSAGLIGQSIFLPSFAEASAWTNVVADYLKTSCVRPIAIANSYQRLQESKLYAIYQQGRSSIVFNSLREYEKRLQDLDQDNRYLGQQLADVLKRSSSENFLRAHQPKMLFGPHKKVAAANHLRQLALNLRPGGVEAVAENFASDHINIPEFSLETSSEEQVPITNVPIKTSQDGKTFIVSNEEKQRIEIYRLGEKYEVSKIKKPILLGITDFTLTADGTHWVATNGRNLIWGPVLGDDFKDIALAQRIHAILRFDASKITFVQEDGEHFFITELLLDETIRIRIVKEIKIPNEFDRTWNYSFSSDGNWLAVENIQENNIYLYKLELLPSSPPNSVLKAMAKKKLSRQRPHCYFSDDNRYFIYLSSNDNLVFFSLLERGKGFKFSAEKDQEIAWSSVRNGTLSILYKRVKGEEEEKAILKTYPLSAQKPTLTLPLFIEDDEIEQLVFSPANYLFLLKISDVDSYIFYGWPSVSRWLDKVAHSFLDPRTSLDSIRAQFFDPKHKKLNLIQKIWLAQDQKLLHSLFALLMATQKIEVEQRLPWRQSLEEFFAEILSEEKLSFMTGQAAEDQFSEDSKMAQLLNGIARELSANQKKTNQDLGSVVGNQLKIVFDSNGYSGSGVGEKKRAATQRNSTNLILAAYSSQEKMAGKLDLPEKILLQSSRFKSTQWELENSH